MTSAPGVNLLTSRTASGRFPSDEGELEWLNCLRKVREQVISPTQAAEKMGITERWVLKLVYDTEVYPR